VRSLAAKIFLGFWLIHALIFLVLALWPDTRDTERFANFAHDDGMLAVTMLEQGGSATCAAVVAHTREHRGTMLAVFSASNTLVCPAAPLADARLEVNGMPATSGDRVGARVVVPVTGPSGTAYTVVALRSLPDTGRREPPPFPTNLLVTTVLVSGVVCLLLARYLAHPIGRIRSATYRLAAGDLTARAGATLGTRRDEIGDLVRDFDAMANRIAALMQAQTQLLSDMSHELRSPLARLNVALELARRKSPDTTRPELDRIQAEIDRMNALIGQVLALARAERDDTATARDVIDLADVIGVVAADAEYEATQQDKHVAARAAAGAEVQGDASVLASALENVVRNAIRHTATGTTVEISLSTGPDTAVVTVRDHGPGVPDEELEKIFAPFHRVGSARTRESGGTGLGLAIARRAVALHGGTIRAANAAGGGLEVTLTMPRRTRSA